MLQADLFDIVRDPRPKAFCASLSKVSLQTALKSRVFPQGNRLWTPPEHRYSHSSSVGRAKGEGDRAAFAYSPYFRYSLPRFPWSTDEAIEREMAGRTDFIPKGVQRLINGPAVRGLKEPLGGPLQKILPGPGQQLSAPASPICTPNRKEPDAMAELVYDKTGRLLFTREMKEE